MQKVADRQPQTTDPQRSDADRDRSVESVDETAEREKGPSSSSRRLAIRTRFCDDYFENCAGARGIKQVHSAGEIYYPVVERWSSLCPSHQSKCAFFLKLDFFAWKRG